MYTYIVKRVCPEVIRIYYTAFVNKLIFFHGSRREKKNFDYSKNYYRLPKCKAITSDRRS